MTKAKIGAAEKQTPCAFPFTKKEAVLNLLRDPEGTTLSAIVAATSWQPHTVRAVLTGLRKKGYSIERSSRDGATCYRLAAEPQQ